MRYFLRDFVNRVQGRSRFKEEFLDLQGVFNLIANNSDDAEVKISYYHPAKRLFREKTNPKEAAEWALKVFRSKKFSGQYVEATHKVYSGNHEEMHYITLSHGSVENSWGQKRKAKIGIANIEFLVKGERITGEELFSYERV